MLHPLLAALAALLVTPTARAASLTACPDLGVTPPPDAALAAVGDLDGDGLPDIVLRSGADGTLHALFSSAPAAITPLPLPLRAGRVDAAALDVNADGVLDIVKLENEVPSGWGPTDGATVAFGPLSAAAPQWSPSVTTWISVELYGGEAFATLPDLDNDGADELIVGQGDFLRRRVLLSGGLLRGLNLGFGVGWSDWWTDDMSGMFDAGDLDGDGLRELVATGGSGSFLLRGTDVATSATSGAPLYGDTDGVELAASGSYATAAVATDFDANADGYDDLLLMAGGRVYLLHGRRTWPGSGGLLAASNRWSGGTGAITSLALVRGAPGRSMMAVVEAGVGALAVPLPAAGPPRARVVPTTWALLPDGTREATSAPLATADFDGDGQLERLILTDDAGAPGLCWMR